MKGVPEVGVSEEGACCKDRLPVKFQDVKFKDPKYMEVYENRHEAFILLKLFIICFPSVVEIIIELFVGDGLWWMENSLVHQILIWYAACFECCKRAHCVGGIFSIDFLPWQNNCIIAVSTLSNSLVLS